MTDKYDREGRQIDTLHWAKLFENIDYKVVQRDVLENGMLVSTVWLGLDHRFGEGPPLIFETMVFPGGRVGAELDMERYTTEEEARKGHAAMVKKWSTSANR